MMGSSTLTRVNLGSTNHGNVPHSLFDRLCVQRSPAFVRPSCVPPLSVRVAPLNGGTYWAVVLLLSSVDQFLLRTNYISVTCLEG